MADVRDYRDVCDNHSENLNIRDHQGGRSVSDPRFGGPEGFRRGVPPDFFDYTWRGGSSGLHRACMCMQTPCKHDANTRNPGLASCKPHASTLQPCLQYPDLLHDASPGLHDASPGLPTSRRLMPSVNVTRDTRIAARMCSPPRAHPELALLPEITPALARAPAMVGFAEVQK